MGKDMGNKIGDTFSASDITSHDYETYARAAFERAAETHGVVFGEAREDIFNHPLHGLCHVWHRDVIEVLDGR